MMKTLLKSFLSEGHGATAVEYGLLAALISVGMLAGFAAVGGTLNNTFMTLSDKIKPAD